MDILNDQIFGYAFYRQVMGLVWSQIAMHSSWIYKPVE